MSKPRVMVLRSAGTNCDVETVYAWELAGAAPQRVHLRRAMESPALLGEYDILTIPGGFSYGDDLGAGTIFARQLARRLADAIRDFVDRGRLVLGICNGFQILVKAGLLPEPARHAARNCTITSNDPTGFQDRWVRLRGGVRHCPFVEYGREYEMPIAHGEGRVVFSDVAALDAAVAAGCGAVTYCEPPPQPGTPFNPNGSTADLAGMCDPSGRIFGLMPHPDRFVSREQHPHWTSRPQRDTRECAASEGPGDGLAMFTAAVIALRGSTGGVAPAG